MSNDQHADLDLRMVPPAVGSWAGALIGLTVGPAASSPMPLLLYVLGLAVVVVCARRWWSQRPRALGRWQVPTLVGMGCAMAAFLGCLVRVATVNHNLVATLADSGAVVEARVSITGDPHDRQTTVPTVSATPLVVVPGTIRFVAGRGQRARLRAPVIVVGHDRRWRAVQPGQLIAVTGRLSPTTGRNPVVAVLSVRGPPSVVEPAGAVQKWAQQVRSGLRRAVTELSPGPRGLLPGLVFGDTGGLPAPMAQELTDAGLSHVVAVSGANLALLVAAVGAVARRTRMRFRVEISCGVLCVVSFLAVVRPEPSVVRAGVMALIVLTAQAFGGQRRGVSALATAVFLVVTIDPWQALSLGFALSVAATAGIVVLSPQWRDAWVRRGCPRFLAEAGTIPLAAQVCCSPLLAFAFGGFSLIAVPANLVAAPAVLPATLAGVTAAAAEQVHHLMAWVPSRVAGVAASWILLVGHIASQVPYGSVAIPKGWEGAGCVGAALLFAPRLFKAARSVPRPAVIASVIVVSAATCLPIPGSVSWPPESWLMVACDVGQGDALVLKAGPQSAVVVDSGPDSEAVDRCLRALEVRHISLLLLTHFHVDHVGGVPGVLRGRTVSEIGVSPLEEPAEQAALVKRWARAASVPIRTVVVGENRSIPGLTWTVLWPARLIEGEGSAPNNASVVLLIDVSGLRILLAGDIEPAAQHAVVEEGGAIGVDVLKVAHHGSAYQDPEFLAATHPRLAVVSVGQGNRYGHPSARTVESLERAGAAVLRTDRDGAVAIVGPPGRLRAVRQGSASPRRK
jgi:competence protein ComEC